MAKKARLCPHVKSKEEAPMRESLSNSSVLYGCRECIMAHIRAELVKKLGEEYVQYLDRVRMLFRHDQNPQNT